MRFSFCIAAAALLLAAPALAAEHNAISQPIICALDHRDSGRFADNMFVRLAIDSDGALHWNDAAISQRQFLQYLTDAGKMMPRPVFSFIADPEARFAVVAPIALRVQQAGIRWMYPGAMDDHKHYIGCEVIDRWANRKTPTVNLQIKADGSIVWSGRKISEQQLADYFAQAGRANPVPQINILPSSETPYGRMMSIIAAAYKGGVTDIAFGPYQR